VTDERDAPESMSSSSGVRPRENSWLAVARRFWRLWGLVGFLLLLVIWVRGIVLPCAFATLVDRRAPGARDGASARAAPVTG
jgi:hypothetical protein